MEVDISCISHSLLHVNSRK